MKLIKVEEPDKCAECEKAKEDGIDRELWKQHVKYGEPDGDEHPGCSLSRR